MTLADKIVGLSRALTKAKIPHAFGGALALAWCTGSARGTIDIDLNVFVDQVQVDELIVALPAEIEIKESSLQQLRRDGQTRLWWQQTPVDLFINTTDFHPQAAERIKKELFAGEEIPFLGCSDLAVFKAFFNRTKDWADLEAMQEAGTLDLDRVVGTLARYVGADDERVAKLLAL